jgi:hypothetical protein
MPKVETMVFKDRFVSISFLLDENNFGYCVYQVKTDRGNAIFTDEKDAIEFANVKNLDEQLSKIGIGTA